MKRQRVAFYGHFGGKNFGNECTLHALLVHFRRRLPDAELFSICSDPGDVTAQHGIPAVPMSVDEESASPSVGPRSQKPPVPVRLYRRLHREVRGVHHAFTSLRAATLFVVAGTGVLEDTGWSAAWYFGILKWCVIARLRGARVCFVSVGMGPIRRPLSRFLTRAALRLAHFVSYRDAGSLRYGHSMSVDTSQHHQFPDVAFGLGPETDPVQSGSGHPLVVGVGVMDYFGPQDGPKQTAVHEHYLDTMVGFVTKLLERGYRVRMLYGDARYDPPVLAEVMRRVAARAGLPAAGTIETPHLHDFRDVMTAIASADLVVSPRFHNLVLALILGKPVMSLSYHPKNDDLLSDFGLRDYCHSLETFELDRCLDQFERLAATMDEHMRRIRPQLIERRRLLDAQYELLGMPPLDTVRAAIAAEA
jgi:polysaccharide pyruvyl transferase WcaK-like protein